MPRILAVLLVGAAICPASAFAGQDVTRYQLTGRSTTEYVKALAAIDRGAQVALTLRNKSVITGRLDHVGERALYVVDSRTGTIEQIAIRSLDKLQWWPDPSLKTRILVLSGAAAVTVLAGLAAR